MCQAAERLTQTQEMSMAFDTLNREAFSKPLVHLAGCDVLEMPSEDIDPLADISVTRDELIAYALVLRPHYDKVGRLIGQLAGLFILAQARGRFDPGFEAFATPLEQARECADALHSIAVPPAARRQHWCVCRAMHLIDEVTAQFTKSLRGTERVREQVAAWNDQLKRANTLLRWSSDRSLGLNPVDFSQACCCGAGAKK
jgi:hypothetical protein